jgi:isopenicillin N synthase-like dioxygenase
LGALPYVLLQLVDACLKETFEIGSEENKANYNIWLPEDVLPGFREFALELFRELNVLSDAILEALMMSIGLSEEEAQTLRALHTGHDNQLRWAHYPPVKGDTSEVSRLGAHTDFT